MQAILSILAAAWRILTSVPTFTIHPAEPEVEAMKLAELRIDAHQQIAFWQKEEALITDKAVKALRSQELLVAKKHIQQARVIRRRISMEFDRMGGRDPHLVETEKDLDQIRCNMIKRIDEVVAEDPWKYQE